MNKDKFFYNQIILDYIPTKLLKKVTAKQILKWSKLLYDINFDDTKNVYCYLDKKFNKL